MEISLEYWNALANQTLLISSLLSGFSITVVANIIVSEKNSKQTRSLVKEMKQVTEKVASELAIPSEILARKRELEAFLLSSNRANSKFIRGWRASYLSGPLMRIIDSSN